MGKYIKCISTDWVYNWQSVDFVFDQWIYSIKKAEEKNIYFFLMNSGWQLEMSSDIYTSLQTSMKNKWWVIICIIFNYRS